MIEGFDPASCLEALRADSEALLGDGDEPYTEPAAEIIEVAIGLARNFRALDDAMSQGNELPPPWARSRGNQDRHLLAKQLGELLAGLGAPVSIQEQARTTFPLGRKVPAIWTTIHRRLIGFGWGTPEQYAAGIIEIMERI